MPPCPAPDTCWFYLVRHAATDNNRARPPRLQGRRTDPGLSDEGHQQAGRTGRALAGHPLDAVYSSPLLRARQTAQAIARPHGLTVQLAEGLIEVDVGDWEGRAWDEIQRADPEAYRLFTADAGVNPYLGGENLATVLARVIPAMEQLMADNLGRVVVAVAHNCVNRAYLTHLLNLPLARYRSIPQDNCGLNLIRYRDGKVKLVSMNVIGHL
jgi:broad specificity phosphatase PhoE